MIKIELFGEIWMKSHDIEKKTKFNVMMDVKRILKLKRGENSIRFFASL